jgi:hypothetical protein
MISGDYDSWHHEWMVVADNNMRRGETEEAKGPYPDRDELLPARGRHVSFSRVLARA